MGPQGGVSMGIGIWKYGYETGLGEYRNRSMGVRPQSGVSIGLGVWKYGYETSGWSECRSMEIWV